MASDYSEIRDQNKRRYGTDVGRYGKRLLTDLYDDRTHFIYELLQNAEDALRRRTGEPPSKTVRFELSEQALRISHYGKPFDKEDVEGICGIASGTKQEVDVTQIGRFGIGFKSVYGFTDRPEIHSGDEDFGIDSYVWPSAQSAIERDPDETVFIMPLRDPDKHREEIAKGLQRISLDTLLFLRKIDAIEWVLPDGKSGTYVRESIPRDNGVRQVIVIGESPDHAAAEKTWLVFSKPTMDGDLLAGHIEVAFLLEDDRIVSVPRSPLVVFFPTVVETHLDFRVQGPYRTTPSRDNVPRSDDWNQRCVKETGKVLVDALVWLRNQDMLDVDVLRCLPINRRFFDDDNMFASLYECVKDAVRAHDLLPVFGGRYAVASRVKLARTQDLRELFDSQQLKQLFKSTHSMLWLTDSISQDRTPDLRTYLMEDLYVDEITPQIVLSKIRPSFLKRQSNEWMCRLYEFLKRQPALHRRAKVAPIIRLSDGTHVPAFVNDAPRAFLPGPTKTEFPTVHSDTCQSADAKQFLTRIGLSEPDPVDDVIRNVLPKYTQDNFRVSDSEYAADIDRILGAFRTKASDKREELIQYLRETPFVRAVSADDDAICLMSPNGLYLATERLKELFANISGIKMVDDHCDALGGDGIRYLLESCGAVRYLLPIKKKYSIWLDCPLSAEDLEQLREQSGQSKTSGQRDIVTDWTLRGLGDVLAKLPSLDAKDRRNRARCIWEALIQLEERRGRAVFRGEYRWTYYGRHKQGFDSTFVKQLNDTAWIPGQDGGLHRPNVVLFKSLGWRDDPFLLSKVRFKPSVVHQLAKEAGIEPEVLDRLKERGITSVEALEKLLDEYEDRSDDVDPVKDAADSLGGSAPGSSPAEDPTVKGTQPWGRSSRVRARPGAYDENAGVQSGRKGDRVTSSGGPGTTRRTDPPDGAGRFISYVEVGREIGGDDPDGLAHDERMRLEEAAISLILDREREWRRTGPGQPGFDLFRDEKGQRSWCEVKAMKGDLRDRPVTLSRTQFECARKQRERYWLYVVERASSEDARIVRIQDPVGKAKTFTFDKGWLDVAVLD